MYGERWEEEEKEKAKQRHRDAVALSNKSRKKESLMCEVPYPDTCPDMDSKQDSRDSIGRRVGVSGKSIDRARTVRQHAPDLAEKVTNAPMHRVEKMPAGG